MESKKSRKKFFFNIGRNKYKCDIEYDKPDNSAQGSLNKTFEIEGDFNKIVGGAHQTHNFNFFAS